MERTDDVGDERIVEDPGRGRPIARADDGLPADPDDSGDELLHELRTPVTVIAGLMPALIGQIDALPAAALRELLQTVSRNATHLAELLDAHDELRRLQTGAMPICPIPVDLRRLVEEAAGDVRVALGDHEVAVRGPAEQWADVDALRVRQILLNLLSNAAKFGAPGSPVEVQMASEAGVAVIRVVNQGRSPGPEERALLFRRYGRIDGSAAGRGLGLYISEAIARAHGGTIDIEEGVPGTTTFVLRLPTRDRQPTAL